MVGLIPLFAVETLEPEHAGPSCRSSARGSNGSSTTAPTSPRWCRAGTSPVRGERRLLSLLRGHRMKCLPAAHARRDRVPLRLRRPRAVAVPRAASLRLRLRRPAARRSATSRPSPTAGLFGGNSNWRGPIWFPVNYLLIESLQKFHHYYGDDFKVECPTGSGNFVTIEEVADELTRRLTRLFLRDEDGRRRSSATTRSCRTIRTSATTCCSTNTSTATTAAASAPRTRPAGPAWSPSSCSRGAARPPSKPAIQGRTRRCATDDRTERICRRS